MLPILAIGAAIGALNGALHVLLRIPSFMVTLGTWFAGVGVATLLLGGARCACSTRRCARWRCRGCSVSRPSVWVALAGLLLAWVVQHFTRTGRHVFAIGGGEDLAALSGIAVSRVRSPRSHWRGLFYALGGVLAAAQLGQGNAVIGEGRLFTTITAVVVGGTALSGGEGGVLNTLIGVLVVAVLANGMVLLGISPYWQQTVQGLMIVAAVALSLDRARLRIVK